MRRKGVTLLEVILTAVIMGVLLLALTPYIRSIHRSWLYGDRRTEMLQQARIAMDRMEKVIRSADSIYDINNAGTGNYMGVTKTEGAITTTNIFFYNIAGSPYYTAPSGNIGNNDLVMRTIVGATTTNSVLAKSLTGLAFTYLRETMDLATPATLEADVRGARIEMTISDPTGEFTTPLLISTTVHCRFGG